MYGCEAWVLKEAIKQKLLVFERKILRGPLGPTKELNGTWRIKTNSELNKLIKDQTIINFIKAQRLSWLGHIHQMDSDRMVKKYMTGNQYPRHHKADQNSDGKMI
jgi:hypothetical protein